MKENIYREKSVPQLIILFGVPSILALIVEMLTGITDTAFAGNIAGAGENALAAMALISPLLSIFTALQTLFAMSSGILIAKYFDDEGNRKSVLIIGVLLSMIISAIASIICGVWLNPIFQTIGVEGEILQLAASYMKIQLVSNIVSSIGYTMTCAIRAVGYPKVEMIIITIAVALNIFFNAVLSFGFNMGITGLALGTFISELICVALAILFLAKKGMFLLKQHISLAKSCSLGIEMFKIGFAQTAIQMLAGCSGFFVNSQLLNFGSSFSVAAWNIAQRIYIILLMPIVGLSQGVQTIIAYFYGSGEQQKVKEIALLTQKYCFLYGVFALIAVNFYGNSVLKLFGGSTEILTSAKIILAIIFSCFPLVGIFYTNLTLLQVTGREVQSVILAVTRQVFLVIPLIFLLPRICMLFNTPPIIGLFLAIPMADCIVVLLAAF